MKAAARKSASRFSVATMLSGYLAAYAITLERGARGVRGRPDGE
jgi:hypothetical protein